MGGFYSPITEQRSDNNLMLNHPELNFSPIYTYASDKALIEKLDPSIKGKAVVLVTSDTLLSPDKLLDEYITQKQDPENHTARVRLLVLGNYGLRFDQLIKKSFIDKFQKGDSDRKPFRQNFTGIRMYTTLWNWRAGLIRFNRALNEWMSKHDYDESQVEIITKADQMLYDAYTSEKYSERSSKENAAMQFLIDNGLSGEDLKNLKDFNDKDCADVPTFRLGYSKNGNGFYVRSKFDLTESSLYNNKDANLLAITPKKSEQFLHLVSRIFSSIEDPDEWGMFSLGVKLLKEDKSTWKPDELINLTEANHVRTLSGLLTRDQQSLIIRVKNDDGTTREVAYADGDQWSMIPALIANVTRTITHFQNHESELFERDGELQHVKTTLGDKDDETYVMTQIGDLFTQGYLKFGNDSSLFDMFNLMFHGTVDDLHKIPKKNESLPQLEDAYFKHGFFINPDASREYDPVKNDFRLKVKEDAKQNALFFEIVTTPELFTVDTEVRTSGVGLRIDRLFNQKVTLETKSESDIEVDKETLFRTKYPYLSELIDTVNNFGQEYDYSLSSVDEAIIWLNEKNLRNIRTGIESKDNNVINYTYKILRDNDKLMRISLQDHITAVIGSNNFTVDIESDFVITSGDDTYIMDSNFEIRKIESKVPRNEEMVESKYDMKMSNGKTIKDNLLEALENEEVLDAIASEGKVSRDDLDPLYNSIVELFNSEASDIEIKDALNQFILENAAYEQFATFLMTTEEYLELHEALRNC